MGGANCPVQKVEYIYIYIFVMFLILRRIVVPPDYQEGYLDRFPVSTPQLSSWEHLKYLHIQEGSHGEHMPGSVGSELFPLSSLDHLGAQAPRHGKDAQSKRQHHISVADGLSSLAWSYYCPVYPREVFRVKMLSQVQGGEIVRMGPRQVSRAGRFCCRLQTGRRAV